jgi:hypothetical protein
VTDYDTQHLLYGYAEGVYNLCMNHLRLDYNINWNQTKFEHGLQDTNHVFLIPLGTELHHQGRLACDSVTYVRMILIF